MKHRVDISRGIKLGAHHYPIKADKATGERLKEGSFYGRCYHTEHKILVDRDLPESKFNETVLHEIVEAVNSLYCNGGITHRNIVCLSNGLTQALSSLDITFTHKERERKNATNS